MNSKHGNTTQELISHTKKRYVRLKSASEEFLQP